MRRPVVLLAVTVLMTGAAFADGLVPPRPYHYLHPPAALRRTNRRPAAGHRTVALIHGRTPQFTLFTGDRQAGLGAHAGTFSMARPARLARIRIAPVDVPPGLPRHARVDGNAYAVAVTGVPGGRTGTPRQAFGLVLGWPHRPSAIYRFAGHRWSRACAAPRWGISPGIVFCNVRALGTFVAVR